MYPKYQKKKERTSRRNSEEIMVETVLKTMKDTKTQIQESQGSSGRINTETNK